MLDSYPTTSSTSTTLSVLPALRIARKGALAVGIKVTGAGVMLLLQITLSRTLGHTGYGQYAYVFAWLQLVLLFAQGGFTKAALRYVAEYRARSQPELARGFVRRASQIALLESLTLALLMAGCAVAWGRPESASWTTNFLIASAALPIFSQYVLCSAIVRGLGHVIPSMLLALAQPLAFLGVLLTSAYVLQVHLSASRALLLNLGAAACVLVMVYVLRRRFEEELGSSNRPVFRTGEWFGTACQMLASSSLVYLQGRTGIVISGLLLNAGDAGTYAVVERLTDVVLLGMTSLNLLVAPSISALYAQGKRVQLQRYVRLAAWGATFFMLATTLPLVCFGKPILRLFGEEFVAGYSALMILLAGAAVNAMCGSVGILLNMTGHHRQVIFVALASLSVNLVLSIVLVPRFGILGTSMAVAASIALTNIALMLTVRWRLGMWSCIGNIR